MELAVYNIKGEDTGRKVTLNDEIFAIAEPNEHAVYLDVKQYMANKRQGTHKAKERSEIAGSTKKLGRQKGGGGARHGDTSPRARSLWAPRQLDPKIPQNLLPTPPTLLSGQNFRLLCELQLVSYSFL